jgi:hypothetical protein
MWLSILGTMAAVAANGQNNSSTKAVPYWPTNSYWTALEINPTLYDTPYHVSLFKPQNGENGARVWSQTKSMLFYGAGVALFLAALPESATGWDTETDIFGKWVENVKSGPVWDHDDWAYNYIGHAYVGGVYYQVARKSGYRQWDSFVYTALMSTFYWEYGIEAFAEVPSIQDLVYTPLIGWVYGEWAYQTELKVRDNNNEVAGSKILGETSLFFLDPIDSLGRGVNRLVGRRWIKSGHGYFSYAAAPDGTDTDHTVYLNMNFPIGGSNQPEVERDTRHLEFRNDPVDTGIVGISIGTGHTLLDNDWGVENGLYTKITLGLYVNPCLSARAGYAWADLKKATGETVIYENYSLDAQYYLNSKRRLRPFITAGFGEQLWDENLDLKTFQLNAGLGLHWQLYSKWALQAEWVNYYSFQQDTYDQNINASLVYRFGQGEHNDW